MWDAHSCPFFKGRCKFQQSQTPNCFCIFLMGFTQPCTQEVVSPFMIGSPLPPKCSLETFIPNKLRLRVFTVSVWMDLTWNYLRWNDSLYLQPLTGHNLAVVSSPRYKQRWEEYQSWTSKPRFCSVALNGSTVPDAQTSRTNSTFKTKIHFQYLHTFETKRIYRGQNDSYIGE